MAESRTGIMQHCLRIATWALAFSVLVGVARPAAAESKIGFLAEKLRDSSFKVRLKAAVLLGRMADGRAVGPLCIALQDDNYVVRGASARALGNLGHPLAVSAVGPLLKLVKDEEAFVRNEAFHALERLSGIQSLDYFISALSNEDSAVRQVAVHMLATINSPEARSAIIPALGDNDEEVRSEAIVAVKGLGQAEMEGLLLQALAKKDDYQVQAAAARLIGEMRLTAASGQLADLLVNVDVVPDVKREAAAALVSMKQALDVPALIAQLGSPDRATQNRAIRLLGLHAGTQAVDALIGLLRHQDPFVRRWAVSALGDARDARAIAALESVLNSDDPSRSKEEIEEIGRTLRKLKR